MRELFKRHRIDHLVVTQRKAVVGIAADRDLRDSSDDTRVSDVMTRRVTTIAPDETVRKAASLMVIGAQHKWFSDATVIGTTTERITRFAKCPVLTVVRRADVEKQLAEQLLVEAG